MTKGQEIAADVAALLRARNPLIWIVSKEEARVEAGVYATEEQQFGFRAGSYGGYNEWREQLCRFAYRCSCRELWRTARAEGPFIELINFSDAEGLIGPVVSAKLAKDFKERRPAAAVFAKTLADGGGWWLESYVNWAKAFEMAADGGAVRFH